MTNRRFDALFGGPARKPASTLTQREMDLARSIQVVIEEAILRTARHAQKLTGEKALCLAGGVALDCVAIGRLLREGPFADIWIQPAAGDAGGALGAALDVWHTYFEKPRTLPANGSPRQVGSFFGPSYSDQEIRAFLETRGYPHRALDPATRGDEIAAILAAGKVVGHFSGRLPYGPRSPVARAGDEETIDVRDDPLVCTPDDAYRCLMRTEMDDLVMGNFLLEKQGQPPWADADGGADVEEDAAYPRGFTGGVSSAFFTDFLPRVSGLPGESIRVSTAFRRLPTTWTEVRRAADRRAVFAIPLCRARLDAWPRRIRSASPEPSPSFWEPGPATEAMRGSGGQAARDQRQVPCPCKQRREDDDGQGLHHTWHVRRVLTFLVSQQPGTFYFIIGLVGGLVHVTAAFGKVTATATITIDVTLSETVLCGPTDLGPP